MNHEGHMAVGGSSTTSMGPDSKMANTMNHGSSNSMGGMVMSMVFFTDITGYQVLFSFWRVDYIWQFIVSLFACFFMAFVYEIVRVYKQNHLVRDFRTRKVLTCLSAASPINSPRTTLQQVPEAANAVDEVSVVPGQTTSSGSCCHTRNTAVNSSGESTQVLLNRADSPRIESQRTGGRCKKGILGPVHIVQTLLHIFLTSLGFILMLIVMTFNVWLFLAVIAGIAFGYFVSAHLAELPVDSESCCM